MYRRKSNSLGTQHRIPIPKVRRIYVGLSPPRGFG